ncbi:hypothetical protein [Rhizobium leguminosarum]|nr:hypothetical protein [Rhizobium leguminosarum]
MMLDYLGQVTEATGANIFFDHMKEVYPAVVAAEYDSPAIGPATA